QGEDGVVEALLVETRAQLAFGFRAQVAQRAIADVVGQRLARPGDVTVDLVLDVELRQCRVAGQVVDRLLPRPALRMQAGVDHQARRAPHFHGQAAEVL